MTQNGSLNLFLMILFAVANPAYARMGDCGPIYVDCLTHKIKIGSMEKTVNCGAAGKTPSTRGVVGGPHHGEIVPDGVDIRAKGMGQDGGGKVFHTPNPRDPSSVPTGVNNSKGCVTVDLETLNKLKTCEGSPLEIIGSDGSTDSSYPGHTSSSSSDSDKDKPYNDPNNFKMPAIENAALGKKAAKVKKNPQTFFPTQAPAVPAQTVPGQSVLPAEPSMK